MYHLTQQNFKSLIFTTGIFATVLGLTLPTQAQARRRAAPAPAAPICDISIEQELITRTNEQRIKRFKGNRDYIGRKWWLDLAMVPADLLIIGLPMHTANLRGPSDCTYYDTTSYYGGTSGWRYTYDGSGLSRPTRSYTTVEECQTNQRIAVAADGMFADPEGASWDEIQKVEVQDDCNNYIRNHFENTIISDDGNTLFSRNYYCTPAEQILTNHGRVRRWASYLVRYTAVTRTVTDEQVKEWRCNKVRNCQLHATTTEQLATLAQMYSIQLECGF